MSDEEYYEEQEESQSSDSESHKSSESGSEAGSDGPQERAAQYHGCDGSLDATRTDG